MLLIGSRISIRSLAVMRQFGVSFGQSERWPSSSMGQQISIVDDDDAVREALERLLNSLGFQTKIFASAQQFLNSDQPYAASCLILDVRMPEMGGLELQDYLISQGQYIPTILITATPTPDEHIRAIANGAVSYLAKPLTEQTLLASLHDAMAFAEEPVTDPVPPRS